MWLLPINLVAAEQQNLAEKLHQAYADVSYFKAEFVQEKRVKYLSAPLISKGFLKFSNEHGMVWEITHPIWVKTIITDQGIFKTNRYHSNKKVNDVQMKAVAGILSELLSAQLDRIKSQFEISEVNIETDSNHWQVTLLSQSPLIKKALNSLVIEGNLGSETHSKGIDKIQITDQADNVTVISLHSIEMGSEPGNKEWLDDFQ